MAPKQSGSPEVLVATTSFLVGSVRVTQGDTIQAGHPLLRGRAQFFKPFQVTFPFTPAVEPEPKAPAKPAPKSEPKPAPTSQGKDAGAAKAPFAIPEQLVQQVAAARDVDEAGAADLITAALAEAQPLNEEEAVAAVEALLPPTPEPAATPSTSE